MKTQVNKFEHEQAVHNKVMLISILVFGAVLLSFVFNDLFQTNYSVYESSLFAINSGQSDLMVVPVTDKDNDVARQTLPAKLTALEANLGIANQVVLEKRKLRTKMKEANLFAYQQMLGNLSNEEEPELMIAEVMPGIASQRKAISSRTFGHVTRTADPYLAGLYAEFNEKVHIQIAYGVDIQKEDGLEIENWMTADLGFTAQKAKLHPVLAQELKEMNKVVAQNIEFSYQMKQYLAVDTEEPLQVENWMVDARCWCPEEKKQEHWYKESYAMSNK